MQFPSLRDEHFSIIWLKADDTEANLIRMNLNIPFEDVLVNTHTPGPCPLGQRQTVWFVVVEVPLLSCPTVWDLSSQYLEKQKRLYNVFNLETTIYAIKKKKSILSISVLFKQRVFLTDFQYLMKKYYFGNKGADYTVTECMY